MEIICIKHLVLCPVPDQYLTHYYHYSILFILPSLHSSHPPPSPLQGPVKPQAPACSQAFPEGPSLAA